jgi:hypothetical protein
MKLNTLLASRLARSASVSVPLSDPEPLCAQTGSTAPKAPTNTQAVGRNAHPGRLNCSDRFIVNSLSNQTHRRGPAA